MTTKTAIWLFCASALFCEAEEQIQLSPADVPRETIEKFLGIVSNRLEGNMPNSVLNIQFIRKENGVIVQEQIVGGVPNKADLRFVEFIHSVCSGLESPAATRMAIATGTASGRGSFSLNFVAGTNWYSHTGSPSIDHLDGRAIWNVTGENVGDFLKDNDYDLEDAWKKTKDGFAIIITTTKKANKAEMATPRKPSD